MADANWETIKSEYITLDVSYRSLAQKHGVSFNTLQCRARKEKWPELRKQHHDNIVTKNLERSAKKAADYRNEMYLLAQKIAKQLGEMTEKKNLLQLAKLGIKPRDITGAIKDIEDALHLKSLKDLKEQNLRIKKLSKDLKAAEGVSNSITVVLSSEAQKYSD